MADANIKLDVSITPEARALVDVLRENNERLAECQALLKTCHASIRELPSEFLSKVGFESGRDVEAGVVDAALPSAG